MKPLEGHKYTYGHKYGIWVVIANAYFLLLGIAWLVEQLALVQRFNYIALFMVAVFAMQLYYHNKLLNTIIGILVLFFSLFEFIEVVSAYPTTESAKNLYGGIYIGMFAIFTLAIVFSIILVFSYLIAFKKREGLD